MSRKIGDIIEYTLRIKTLAPEEDLENETVLYEDNYKHNFDISYSVNNNEEFGNYEYTLDEGCYPDFGDDVVGCVKEEMAESFPEVTDYEIFDVNDSDFEYKTAKVRVKAFKEDN